MAGLPLEEALPARVLHSLLLGILIWTIPWLTVIVPVLVYRKATATAWTVVIALSALISLDLLHRAKVRAASWLFMITLWSAATSVVVLSGGIHSVALTAQMAVLVTAAWLLGRRVAGLAWIFFLLLTLVLAILDWSGHRLPNYYPLPPLPLWMGLLLATSLTALPLMQVLRHLGESLALAQKQLRELELSQASLRESEARHRIIFESARDAILVADALSGRIRNANPAASLLLKRAIPDIEGRHHFDFHGSGTLESGQAAFERELYSPGIREVQLRCGDGSLAPAELSTSVMEAADGRKLLIGIARDISERKRGEAERAALRDELQQSQRLESVGRLAGGVAHDFNNLLTVMNGYADLSLLKLDQKHPLHQPLSAIRAAGEEAAGLVKHLLAFSRKQLVQPRLIDLNQVIGDSRDIVHHLLGEDVELVAQLSSQLGRIKADPAQIRQVLVNLVVNARDAMPEGGRLILKTANLELGKNSSLVEGEMRAGSYVLVSVSDNGVGMDESTRQRIFDPFFTTKSAGHGTGLGLSTVYGIVHQCGGSIRVESTPGQGATFIILFPRVSADTPADPATTPARPMDGGSETILVVEDQEAVRKVTAAILTSIGYRVLEASSGVDALMQVRDHGASIRLVVTDVVMPGMTGRELGAQIKSAHPQIKILYVSGYEAVTPTDPSLSFLAKPFEAEGLARRVREMLAEQ